MYFDTHAHLDDKRFDSDRAEVIASLAEHGVSLVINAACDMESARESAALAEKYPFIYASAGVHPHDAENMTDSDFDELTRLCAHEKVVAVGEVGLDYHYDFSPRDIQKRRFADQLELARALKLPVIIHEREAHADCLDILRAYPGISGVMHCFGGSLESAKVYVSMGFMLSFTGVVTFKNARKSAEVVKWLPDDRIMAETDSPYMTPEPHRGKRCDPSYVRLVVEKIAELRGTSPERMAELTMENGKRFFGIK